MTGQSIGEERTTDSKLQRSTQSPLQVSRRALIITGVIGDNLRPGKESSKRIRENCIHWVGEN